MRNLILAMALAMALPAAAKSSAKAEVQCTDGSTAKAGRGACSHHGGVAKDIDQRARNEAREPTSGHARAENNRTGGILGGVFGRRGDSDTPRSETRKSGQPTARCKDGTLSYSVHHSGTCSGHHGVQEWLDR